MHPKRRCTILPHDRSPVEAACGGTWGKPRGCAELGGRRLMALPRRQRLHNRYCTKALCIYLSCQEVQLKHDLFAPLVPNKGYLVRLHVGANVKGDHPIGLRMYFVA